MQKRNPLTRHRFSSRICRCAEYVHLIGRLQWVDGLAKAMVTLVHRAGSLSRIRLPGLARRLAL